tara:strand:+ start:865 stop:972 length:108 start_codon:yes stop_codon:yes gene_type:complete
MVVLWLMEFVDEMRTKKRLKVQDFEPLCFYLIVFA